MVSFTTFALLLLLATFCRNNAQETNSRQMDYTYADYFIEIPANISVHISSNTTVFADFHCAIREGYSLVWIINGVSIDAIKTTPGYNETYYELIPLPKPGNLLSFLSIPVSPITNNSIVICVALSNGIVVSYSRSARLTALGENKDLSSSESNISITTTLSTASGQFTDPSVSLSNNVELIACLSVLASLLICFFLISVTSIGICLVIKRQGGNNKMRAKKDNHQSNVYWISGRKVVNLDGNLKKGLNMKSLEYV